MEEEKSQSFQMVIDLLTFIGENPNRPGLVDTPKRVLKAWWEMTQGYREDPKEILSRDFPMDGYRYDQIISCVWTEFTSVCEHHMLPFSGFAHIAYLPSDENKVVGLSKLGRLLDCFARRLQIQEQLTCQIADALENAITPKGVGVVVQAKHLCMSCRGVKKHSSVMVTSAMRGVFRDEGPARDEFFQLIQLGRISNE